MDTSSPDEVANRKALVRLGLQPILVIDTAALYGRPKALTRPSPADVVAKALPGAAQDTTVVRASIDRYKTILADMPSNDPCLVSVKAELVKAEAQLAKMVNQNIGDDIQSATVQLAKVVAEKAEKARAAKVAEDVARVLVVHQSHVTAPNAQIDELTQLRNLVAHDFATSTDYWKERERCHVEFFETVKLEFDSRILSGKASDPPAVSSVTSPPATQPATLAVVTSTLAHVDKMQEVNRRAAISQDMVKAPRADYDTAELAVLNGLHSFYAGIDAHWAADPACAFADVGISPSVAADLVGKEVWDAFYINVVGEVLPERMIPQQLHVIMRHMLKEAAAQMVITKEAKEQAQVRFADVVKRAGKGGRYCPF